MSVAGVVGVMHDLVRSAGAGAVGLIGAVLLVPTVGRLLAAGGAVADLALAGLGAVVSLVLLGAGYLLHRAAFTPAHTLRVAAWAVLGTGVLGLVVGLMVLAGVALPGHAIGTLLAVSALAHVLIGVRDIQRIRAEDLARRSRSSTGSSGTTSATRHRYCSDSPTACLTAASPPGRPARGRPPRRTSPGPPTG